MVEGDGAFVCEEYLPFREIDYIVGTAGFGEEGLCESLGERTAGDGDFEDLVALDAGILGAEDVASENRREDVDTGEGEEVGLFTHFCGVENVDKWVSDLGAGLRFRLW